MIQLCTNQFCIEIDDTDKSWCKYWLRSREILTYLGAEEYKYLVDHLISFLAGESEESSGFLHGTEWKWILSFAERHYVLYASMNDEEDRTLYLQGNHQETEDYFLTLSKDQIVNWLNQLTLLKEEGN